MADSQGRAVQRGSLAGGRQRSAHPGGDTYRRGIWLRRPSSRAPCRPPRVAALGASASGVQSRSPNHSRTADELSPSARIVARSITRPPDRCGRERRSTSRRIPSSSRTVLSAAVIRRVLLLEAADGAPIAETKLEVASQERRNALAHQGSPRRQAWDAVQRSVSVLVVVCVPCTARSVNLARFSRFSPRRPVALRRRRTVTAPARVARADPVATT